MVASDTNYIEISSMTTVHFGLLREALGHGQNRNDNTCWDPDQRFTKEILPIYGVVQSMAGFSAYSRKSRMMKQCVRPFLEQARPKRQHIGWNDNVTLVTWSPNEES